MAEETDYYGELWSAIREQERLTQARHLLQGIKALPSDHRNANLAAIRAVDILLDLNSMEVARLRMLYEKDLRDFAIEDWEAKADRRD